MIQPKEYMSLCALGGAIGKSFREAEISDDVSALGGTWYSSGSAHRNAHLVDVMYEVPENS